MFGWRFTIASLIAIISVIIGFFIYLSLEPPSLPIMLLKYFGPGIWRMDDRSIKPFHINIPESDLKELQERLANTRALEPPLDDSGFTYGVNTAYLNEFIQFWKTKYNWREREAYLNQYPQFTILLGGLNIHFIHVKPDIDKAKGKKVLPLVLIHGWPGSVREFYKIIPMLTTPRPDADFVFEVIAPSLPGHGFSEAPRKKGMQISQVGLLVHTLMVRLEMKKYYIHGSGWGSFIGQAHAVLLPKKVLGYHSTMCTAMTAKSVFYMALAWYMPQYFVEESKQKYFIEQFPEILTQTGYFHFHATKPDTIGVALTDSPVGLAAYILESFSALTNPAWRSLSDGGLESLDKNDLLDTIMIYWLTKSITPSMRLYKETFGTPEYWSLGVLRMRTWVPTACAWFQHELTFFPKIVLKQTFSNLISVSYMPKGGHFAALEEPKLLTDDIWDFVKNVTKKSEKKRN